MKTNWRDEVPLFVLVVGMFVAAGLAWPFAADRIPVHWNFQGEIDRHGGKFEGLLLLPLIAAGTYVLLLLVPRIDPGRANYQSFESSYRVIRLSILSLLALIDGCVTLAAFGHQINIGFVVPIAMGLLLIVLGNVMGKIRPNWFVGIRTPWTLSSRRSWNKTHRLAGWLFIAMGLAIATCGFIHAVWMIIGTAAVVVSSIFWMVIYSYVVWLDDPERLSPAAISPLPDKHERV